MRISSLVAAGHDRTLACHAAPAPPADGRTRRLVAPALALLLVACTPAAAPTPPTQTSAAFLLSEDAAGPTALAGGAVVLDPGNACPGNSLRLVGAGLPPGEVTIDANGQAIGPLSVRPDGSFEQRLTLAGPAGGAILVRHGGAVARFPLPTCTPWPTPSGSRLPTFTP